MFKQIREELQAIRERDPAAKSLFEIWLLYPGYRAVRSYRRAHWFYEHGHYLIARWISQRAARKTGIEIHPGAKIGKDLFIDHGSGVVIGETSEIGNNCTIYQGATLGGTGKDSGKRHPTLGNNVMVGAGARILGPFTVGENSKIASNAVVLEEVPPNSTAVGVPATIVKRNGLKVQDLDQVHMPDPVSQQFCKQLMLIDKLTEKLNEHIKDANTDTIDIQE